MPDNLLSPGTGVVSNRVEAPDPKGYCLSVRNTEKIDKEPTQNNFKMCFWDWKTAVANYKE